MNSKDMSHYKITNLVLLTLLVITFTGCKKPEEAPEFKGVSEIVVKEIVEGKAIVNAKATFFNPNQVKMKLKNINVDVFVREKLVGDIKQDMNLKIPAESDFVVPLTMSIDINKLGALNSILMAVSQSTIPVMFQGDIRAKVHGMGFTVPINYKDEVDLDFSL